MNCRLASFALAALALALGPVPAAHAGPVPPVVPDQLLGSTGALDNALISIDTATGAGTARFPLTTFGPVTEIEYRSDGVLFGTTGQGTSDVITIDPDTGVQTLVGTHAFGSVNGLEFVGNTLYGSFFAAQDGAPEFLVTVDQTDGSLTTVGQITDYLPVRGLAYDAATSTMYGVGTPVAPPPPPGDGVGDELFTIDLATAATTPVGSTGFDLGSLEFGPDGLLYAGGVFPKAPAGAGWRSGSHPGQRAAEGLNASLIVLDTATGAGTVVGPTGFAGVSGLAFVPGGQVGPSAIEVPTLSALGLGLFAALLLAGAWLALRRRAPSAG
jgi:hypothetical protein